MPQEEWGEASEAHYTTQEWPTALDPPEAIRESVQDALVYFEYTEKAEKFFEKAFYNAKLEGVEVKAMGDSKVAFVKADAANKKILLGNMGRLRKIKELANRNYSIDEVRIR